jgi:hypothetical protein
MPVQKEMILHGPVVKLSKIRFGQSAQFCRSRRMQWVLRYEGRGGPRQDRGATVQGLRDSIGEGTNLTCGPNGHIESPP